MTPGRQEKRPAGACLRFLAPLFAAAVLAAAVLHFGMIHFGGFDGSALLQGAWRYHQGQALYTEIIAPGVPPSYIVFPGMAFGLFGASWHSVVLLTALYAAATLLLQHAMLRRLGVGVCASLGLASAVQAVGMLPLSSWHYNQTTAVAGALFVTASALFIREKGLVSDIFFVACAVLLSWMKVNVAGFLLAGVGIVLLCRQDLRRRFLACLAVAFVFSTALMMATRVSPVALIGSLLEASGRVFSGRMFRLCLWDAEPEEAGVTLLIALVLVGGCCAHAWRHRRTVRPAAGRKALFAVALLGIVAGFVGMATNMEHNMADAPCVFIGAAVWLFVVPSAGIAAEEPGLSRPPATAGMAVACLCIGLLAVTGVGYAVTRARVASIGPGLFYEEGAVRMLSEPALFRGLRSGPRLAADLSELQSVFARIPPAVRRDGRVFFGPRLEFGYPAYGITPPPGMPIWWMGTGEARKGTVDAVVDAFRRWNPACAVFLSGDLTYMPRELYVHLESRYFLFPGRDLMLLWLKTEPLPPFLFEKPAGKGRP